MDEQILCRRILSPQITSDAGSLSSTAGSFLANVLKTAQVWAVKEESENWELLWAFTEVGSEGKRRKT